jgi:hypothetical protein
MACKRREISIPVNPQFLQHGLSMTMKVKAGKRFYLEKPIGFLSG